MPRRSPSLLDYGIEEEIDPKIKFNSLISVAVSTIMCLAAQCPLPRSNVETTKLFLSTITDDNDHTPRNIKGFLSLLNNYNGPYECDSFKERKLHPGKGRSSLEPEPKAPGALPKEHSPVPEPQSLAKRSSKIAVKKPDREANRKASKNAGSKASKPSSAANSS